MGWTTHMDEDAAEPGAVRIRSGGESATPVRSLRVGAFTIPTDEPESDGTLEWNSTTIIVVHAAARAQRGVGYTYAHRAAGVLIQEMLASVVLGMDALSPEAANAAMVRAVRNLGRGGLAARAISAVDCALWDLKAKLLDLPLVRLLGQVRERVPIYGSGGFTSYTDAQLGEQLAGWVGQGIPRVKMKVGREPGRDPGRVRVAREAIGEAAELFVDANGAYTRAQAVGLAERFAEDGVTWFEEPRPSGDAAGLRWVRDRAPLGMEIAAGEYGETLEDFDRLSDAVHVMQADVTRCGGITGLLRCAALCEAHDLQMSGHCAPAQHEHPGAAIDRMRHLEYFHDHVRAERVLFDGVNDPREGTLAPDLTRPGAGLEFKESDAAPFAC